MAYSTIQEEGTNLTQRSTLNFIGDTVTAADNAPSVRTDVTVAAVKLQASSPGTAQTGNFNIDTGIGRLAVQDKGGQLFNVKAYGATGNGSTDDTSAISSAITAAAGVSPPGVVFFPHGNYKTTGNFDLTGKNGISFVGAGVGNTTIELAHATNDLFKYGTSASELRDIHVSDLSITSATVTRTAGWVVRGYTASPSSGYLRRARFERIDVKKQVNGFWFNQFEFVWLNDIMISDFAANTGIGLKIGQTASGTQNQGAGIRCHNVEIYGKDFVLSVDKMCDIGIWIEDVEGCSFTDVGVGNCVTNSVRITPSSSNPGVKNLWFINFASDTTKTGDGVYFTGAGVTNKAVFVGSWLSSSGQASGGGTTMRGLRIEPSAGGGVGGLMVVGSRFFNNKGIAFYADLGTGAFDAVIEGNSFESNGLGGVANNTDSIYIACGLNQLGPTLVGNYCHGAGSGGVSLRTSSNTNLLLELGNRWESNVSLGTTPVFQLVEDQTRLGGAQVSISTTTRTDLASYTFTPKDTARYLVTASFDILSDTVAAGSVLVCELLVDGVAETAGLVLEEKSNGVRVLLSRSWTPVLTGGTSHTVKTTAKLNVAGAIYKINTVQTSLELTGLGRF